MINFISQLFIKNKLTKIAIFTKSVNLGFDQKSLKGKEKFEAHKNQLKVLNNSALNLQNIALIILILYNFKICLLGRHKNISIITIE